MSSLEAIGTVYLESILDMGSGYVLNFTDATSEDFFRDLGVDIHGRKYQTIGTSKAKKTAILLGTGVRQTCRTCIV